MSTQQPYKLAFTLHAHSADVRNLYTPGKNVPLLLSASRDGSAILWGPASSGREWDVKLRVEELEKRYVSCVGMVKSHGEAYLLVGSSSGILTTFVLPSATSPPPSAHELPQPNHTLIEHRQNLCSMDTKSEGLIATGSWDKTVIIWKDFKKAIKIETHQQAVWAVKFVGADRVLTASADKTIVLHSIDVARGSSIPLQTYTGHSDCVRGLSLRPDGQGFWSCANDGLVNLYSFDRPEPIRSLSGHTSFVYSVTAFPDGRGAISSGEDGTLRVWSETDLVQTIAHPSLSLWSSAIIPSLTEPGYYIVSSSSDATIRFFTQSENLMAPIADREGFEKEVGARKLDKSQVGDVKHSDLPGMEALGREGKKDGQVIMIKNNDAVEAYQWSTAEKTWQQIGQVVDAIGSGRKQLYEGKEWDYVFDVDVSEGMPPLKLPYNTSENPWVAAQRFLTANELPTSYADEVVQFIQKNTEGVAIGTSSQETNTYVDPYTGASRYTGSSSAASTGGNNDPYTGGSAYRSSGSQPAEASGGGGGKKGILPVKGYLNFKTGNVPAAKTKIAQLNEEIKKTSPELAYTDSEEKNMEQIYKLLTTPGSTESYDPTSFLGMMERWPEAQRFPLIDIARLLSASSTSFASPILPQTLLAACNWNEPWSKTKPRETNTLLSLRAIANLFSTAPGRGVMSSSAGEVLGALRGKHGWAESGVRGLAVVTIALNYSILAVNSEFPAGETGALLDLVVYILENEKNDPETVYRASVALGNILTTPSIKGNLQVGNVTKARGLVSASAGKLPEKRLKDLAKEIEGLGV